MEGESPVGVYRDTTRSLERGELGVQFELFVACLETPFDIFGELQREAGLNLCIGNNGAGWSATLLLWEAHLDDMLLRSWTSCDRTHA